MTAFRHTSLSFLLILALTGCDFPKVHEPEHEFVAMETTAGTIEIELYPKAAPETVSNFLRYVDAGAYDDGRIWRVVNPSNDNNPAVITVVQGGAREGFDAFPSIGHETTQSTGLTHGDGALSMARAEPGSAQAEFFISIGENASLDYGGARNPDGQGFAVFGRVIVGMDVVRRINAAETIDDPSAGYFSGQQLETPIVLKRVARL